MLCFFLDTSPSDFYFNIDQAWTEIMFVFKWFQQWTFSFTTYAVSKNSAGGWSVVGTPHIFKLMDFITAFFVFTTVDNIVFWWNHRGEFDPYDGDMDG